MTNYPFTKLEEFRDVSTINHIKFSLENNPGLTEEEAVVARRKLADHARIYAMEFI